MKSRIENIANRLEYISELLPHKHISICSLKLILLSPSNEVSKFGYYTHAFQAITEYEAARSIINIIELSKEHKDKLLQTIAFPRGQSEHVVSLVSINSITKIFWLQHETGLELIGYVRDFQANKYFANDIFNNVRKKVIENIENSYSDRKDKNVCRVLVVLRYLKDNNLVERFIWNDELQKNFELSDFIC